MRRGRAVAFVRSDLFSDGGGALATSAVFCFGAPRASRFDAVFSDPPPPLRRATTVAPATEGWAGGGADGGDGDALPLPDECASLFEGMPPSSVPAFAEANFEVRRAAPLSSNRIKNKKGNETKLNWGG